MDGKSVAASGAKTTGKEKEYVTVELGSGKYEFTSTLP
jgi:hypothetical protein